MAHIPIDLPGQAVHIHAQRELAFEMVSSFGLRSGVDSETGNAVDESNMEKNSGRSNRHQNVVLKKDGSRVLVEFHTPLKLGPWSTTWRSTEWVTPVAPESIDFELVPANGIIAGGLRQLNDHFEFEVQGNCTLLTYRSRFGIRWSIGGWVVGKTVIGPIIKSHMTDHLAEVKEMIENRARRSRVYPQKDCQENGEIHEAARK